MSAVVAYIVLKKKREGRLQEPKKKKPLPQRPPDQVPDTAENKELYEEYKSKFIVAYGCTPEPSGGSVRSLLRRTGSMLRPASAQPDSKKSLQPLTYDKWREAQKRRKVFLADQAREMRALERAREMVMNEAGAAAGPVVRGHLAPAARQQQHFFDESDGSLYDNDEESNMTETMSTMSVLDFETAEVAGDLEEWAEMRGPSTRSIETSWTAAQGRSHTAAAATSLAPPRRAAVANVPGAGTIVAGLGVPRGAARVVS